MTRRTFSVIDIVEILVHWHAGRKKAEVARSLGVDRGTVAKYTAKAESEGYVPGGEQAPVQRWAELARGWFPELVDPRQRSLTQTVISEQQRLDQTLAKLSGVVTATQQTAIQSARVKQQNEDNTRRIELLEKQLREQPVPTAATSNNDNTNW